MEEKLEMTQLFINLRKSLITGWNTLVTVNVQDENEARLGRFFIILMVISIVIVLLLTFAFLSTIPLGLAGTSVIYLAISFPIAFFPLSVYCIIQAKYGRIHSSAALYVWTNMVAISFAVLIFDGILSPGWILYIWTITIAGILLTPSHALWMTSGVVVYFFLLLFFTRIGIFQPLTTFGSGREYVETACLLIMLVSTVGLLTFINMRNLHDTLSYLHKEIAERRQTEIALHFSEEKYRTLADFTYDWEAWLAPDGTYRYISPSCERITGHTVTEFMANPDLLFRITHPDDKSKVIEHYHTGTHEAQGGNLEIDFRIITTKNEIRWISHSCTAVYGEDRQWLGRRISNRDITERKRAEEEIKLKNEQLIKLNSEKDTFFSIIAHDLKSPFQGFLGLTEIMAEEAGSFSAEELTRFSNEMYKTATNLYSLLKNLLEWSQMQKGLMSFQPKEFSVSDMIAENVETIKIRSEQKGITVINAVTEPIDIYADENMINSVLLNLLSNAVKFTNRNGTVTVKANKVVDQMIEISICDTGIGMQKSVVEKLFKVGEKIGSKGTDGELSTGLGLLLCNEFVEKHGGRIWVESELGTGSTFSFSLSDMRQ